MGTACSAADIFADPHMAARGDLVSVADPVIGDIRLGEHNRQVWCDLVGLTAAELDQATEAGIV